MDNKTRTFPGDKAPIDRTMGEVIDYQRTLETILTNLVREFSNKIWPAIQKIELLEDDEAKYSVKVILEV